MSYRVNPRKPDAIDKALREACRGTQLDPRTPDSSYMPWLHGPLLDRFLENLTEFEERSRRKIIHCD